ncbi:retrotransposon protein [Cucumis melo var. makuwa]|uniref:Retrotransposon protein n=1 Tax=Cucumis melo var. makuwa TaxID=1194695 RepID=A0A5D3CBV0_CUCMM|nr:retrotransposon protein [Cucumis melo var. makuwa]TYK08668.1 retrotransposon protein [Cucumis melo var. makuwa]
MLLNKPFFYYDELAYVFGCDRTTGRFAKTFADVGFKSLSGMRGLTCPMGTRSSHQCTARGLTCLRRMYVHHDLLARLRVGLDRADRRGRGEASKRPRLKSYIWRWSVRTSNLGRLRCSLANDNHVRQEFFRILREMSKLTSLDRVLLQRHLLSCMDDIQGFVQMPDDERESFCRVLLRDIFR